METKNYYMLEDQNERFPTQRALKNHLQLYSNRDFMDQNGNMVLYYKKEDDLKRTYRLNLRINMNGVKSVKFTDRCVCN